MSQIIAVWDRHHQREQEEFDSVPQAAGRLDADNEFGEAFPIGIFDRDNKVIYVHPIAVCPAAELVGRMRETVAEIDGTERIEVVDFHELAYHRKRE